MLKEHGRLDEALVWAEKGIASFKSERLDDLVEFCIDEHLRRGNTDQAEAMAWQRFLQQPGSDPYFKLTRVAKRIGPAEKLAAKALQHLWQLVRAEETPKAKPLPNWRPPIRSAVVAIHLRQKEAAKAWEAFCGGPVDIRLWDEVAATRGKTHPEDAIAIYKKLLPHVQKRETVFREELAELRSTWRAKRNFIKLLATLV